MLEDTLLRHKYNRGRKDVLPRIYEKYKHDLVSLAAALLQDKSKAEDVVHDLFVSLLETDRQLRINQTLKGYLATAVANRARTASRLSLVRQTTPNSYDPENSVTADNQAVFGEEKQYLVSALAQLPYEQREVILLKIVSGLKFKDIAKSQDVSINTVQGRYRYGLEKLRKLLDGELI
ncbi:MAG: RNA polymerase sigma factor [Phycisphaerae bacterium]